MRYVSASENHYLTTILLAGLIMNRPKRQAALQAISALFGHELSDSSSDDGESSSKEGESSSKEEMEDAVLS